MNGLNPLVRAFELARSGECKTIDDLQRQLTREGYSAVADHLAARSLRRQLVEIIQNPPQ